MSLWKRFIAHWQRSLKEEGGYVSLGDRSTTEVYNKVRETAESIKKIILKEAESFFKAKKPPLVEFLISSGGERVSTVQKLPAIYLYRHFHECMFTEDLEERKLLLVPEGIYSYKRCFYEENWYYDLGSEKKVDPLEYCLYGRVIVDDLIHSRFDESTKKANGGLMINLPPIERILGLVKK